MSTDSFLSVARDVLAALAGLPWPELGTWGVPAALILIFLWSARGKQPDRRLSRLSTFLGLSWMAQGMWDVAANKFGLPPLLAGAIFLVFEGLLATAMFRAERFRDDLPRRDREIRWVWTLALVAGLVVATAEGWAQAPLRFAIPLLVVANWFRDLTADDPVGARQATSWNWTPHNALLRLGAIKPGEHDAEVVNRAYLRDRMTMLTFQLKHGTTGGRTTSRRKLRLAKLALKADDALLAEVRDRMARADAVMGETAPAKATAPPRPRSTPLALPSDDRQVQGVHSRDGRALRGTDLRADGIALMLASVRPGKPRGMDTKALAESYDPPLKQRTAETIAAEARRQMDAPVNGRVPAL